jgi:hypothetical protein
MPRIAIVAAALIPTARVRTVIFPANRSDVSLGHGKPVFDVVKPTLDAGKPIFNVAKLASYAAEPIFDAVKTVFILGQLLRGSDGVVLRRAGCFERMVCFRQHDRHAACL